MPIPTPEEQVQFLFKIQRILSEGGFVSTYKYALLLALADLSVEYGDDTVPSLSLSTDELAEKFIALYRRQVLPWVAPGAEEGHPLHQATGGKASILDRIARAHRRVAGSLSRLRQDERSWKTLVRQVGTVIAVMPLWKLQTVGGQQLDFLYPNVGRGRKISLRGDAVFCFRRFHGLISELAESAWVRFVRGLRANRPVLGDTIDLRDFLFGADRASLDSHRLVLRDLQSNRCFYCERPIRGEGAVDHFIPWSLYPLDVTPNLVLADAQCNRHKSDRLAAVPHLARWAERNASSTFRAAQAAQPAATADAVTKVARWAYSQAEAAAAQVWAEGRDGLVALSPAWRDHVGCAQWSDG
jgi:hypothetical protein